MKNLIPILACGSIDLSPSQKIGVFILAAIWFSGVVWSCLNLFLIFTTKTSRLFIAINLIALLIYVLPVVGFFYGIFGGDIPSIVIGFPIISLSHFICLLCIRRKIRR